MNQDDFFENETLGTAFLFIPMDLDHETAEQKMGCETFREELEKVSLSPDLPERAWSHVEQVQILISPVIFPV